MLELQARPVFVLVHLINFWLPFHAIIQLQEIKAKKAKIEGIEADIKSKQADIHSGKVHHRFTMYMRFILLILSLGERHEAKR